MVPRIDHIELTVADLDRAEPFYDELLPLLGFDLTLICPRPALVGEAVCRRKPGSLHHLAFGVDRREEVDRLYGQVRAIPGAAIRLPPRFYPEYTPDDYAFFFYDTEGIELEIVHFDRPACFRR